MKHDAVERLHLGSSARPFPSGMKPVLFVIAMVVAVCGLPPAIASSDDENPSSSGPLSAAHASLDNPGACISCHEPDLSFTPGKCLACHTPIAERVAAQKGVHREITDECAMCHEEHAGRDAALIVFDTEDFDHLAETGFAIDGMHSEAAADCTICHDETSFLTLDPTCSSCHVDAHAGSFGDDCADCHNVGSPFPETGRTFDHARTGFALNTRHATLPCEVCHGGKSGAALSFDMSDACTTCHLDVHNGELGATCQDCHDGDNFQVSEHIHPGDQAFFRGNHSSASCEDCHESMAVPTGDGPSRRVLFSTVYRADCSTCHDDAHAGTLGASCSDCHDLAGGSFKNASRDFHKDALMPLEGRHLAVPCAECHLNGQIKATPTRCYDCHWIRRQDDRYRTALGADCEQCHRPTSWTAVNWDHGGATGTPLTGAHATLDCEACHTGGRFDGGTPTDCVSCHLGDYQGTDDPNHVEAGFPSDCQLCHSPSDGGWDRVGFNHATFPLVGTHATLDCAECHSSGIYQGLPAECVDCHGDDHQQATNPNHLAAGFDTECETCHTPSDPSWHDGQYPHSIFPLVASHQAQPCNACHSSNVYQGLPSECVDCHLVNYQQTNNPDHVDAGFPTDCELCHSNTSPTWEGAVFDHSGYQLVGTHSTLDCADCHSSGVYQGLPSECVDCHLGNYQQTNDPDHVDAGFPTDCELCHSNSSPTWEGAVFNHSGYQLVGTHATLDCADCHLSGVYQGLPSDCVDCHLSNYQQTNDPDHVDAGFPTDCELCHSNSSPTWEGATFDHTAFQLVGTHATLDCAQCHSSGVYQGLPAECVDCHSDDHQQATNPNHPAAGFDTDCETCHQGSDPSWQNGQYPHSIYPLVASHEAQPCNACHSNNVFQGLPSECVDCHLVNYQQTEDPDHIAAGFPTDCELCHSNSSPTWEGASFDHSAFQLVGTHATLDCAQCHSSGVYQGLPAECVDCHSDDHQQATNPNHPAAGFDTDCETCHQGSDPSWQNGQYPHSIYPLVASHEAQPCNACHSSNVFQGLPSECVDCHLADYQQTDNPDHVAAGFPTDCVLCHSATSPTWNGATFDHSNFQLVGAHTTLDCTQCHSSGVYQGLPSDCVDCHLTDYQQTDDPDHVAAAFPTDCVLCHSATSPTWEGATFDHSNFQLVGAHTSLDCAQCHSSGVYQGLPSDCVDCHLSNYQQTNDPDHIAAGFPTDCVLCHSTTSTTWEGATFDHSNFQLVGAHTSLDCAQCHSSGVYQGLPSDCVDCHLSNYQQTNDPDHIAAGFPTDCVLCHSTTSTTWEGATFDHSNFQLVGAHTTLDCTQCHSSGVYQGLPSDCVDCHLTNYQQTTDPNHVAAGFPTDCVLCHSATSSTWEDADFDHSTYQLLGAHATLDCDECHSSGVYQGLPSECVDCHLNDYQQTSDPNHTAAGFPTDCQICHQASDLSWEEGTFDHTWFPIDSGAHRNFRCSRCHPTAGNYAIFSCTTSCHPRGPTNEDHDEVPGYVYNSAACYSCHPNGQSDFGRRSMVRSHETR